MQQLMASDIDAKKAKQIVAMINAAIYRRELAHELLSCDDFWAIFDSLIEYLAKH